MLKALDRQIPAMRQIFPALAVPSKGWLRAVREAMGMSQRDVAAKIGIKQQPYAAFELREVKGTITIESLQRAAGALDCDVVYFLVPKQGVASNFSELAAQHDPGLEHLRATEHSMGLEGQGVGDLAPKKPEQDTP